MDELTAQITEEIAAITHWLQTRLGRRSRWNGSIRIDCRIVQTDLRWRTAIHESLHHFSVGLSVSHYLNLPGWEEGVVEQLQRTLRGELLASLGIISPCQTSR